MSLIPSDNLETVTSVNESPKQVELLQNNETIHNIAPNLSTDVSSSTSRMLTIQHFYNISTIVARPIFDLSSTGLIWEYKNSYNNFKSFFGDLGNKDGAIYTGVRWNVEFTITLNSIETMQGALLLAYIPFDTQHIKNIYAKTGYTSTFVDSNLTIPQLFQLQNIRILNVSAPNTYTINLPMLTHQSYINRFSFDFVMNSIQLHVLEPLSVVEGAQTSVPVIISARVTDITFVGPNFGTSSDIGSTRP